MVILMNENDNEKSKGKKQKKMPKECIKGATALSVEDFKKVPKELIRPKEKDNSTQRVSGSWWLKNPNAKEERLYYVAQDGDVCKQSETYTNRDVRPVLVLSNINKAGFKVGNTFEFGGSPFVIIADDMALDVCSEMSTKYRAEDEDYDDTRSLMYDDDFDWGFGGRSGRCPARGSTAKDKYEYDKSSLKDAIDRWFKKSYSNYNSEK